MRFKAVYYGDEDSFWTNLEVLAIRYASLYDPEPFEVVLWGIVVKEQDRKISVQIILTELGSWVQQLELLVSDEDWKYVMRWWFVIKGILKIQGGPSSEQPKQNPQGPNLRTQERYKVFTDLKAKHPGWSQAKLALEASKELEEQISAETVRNTYRLMGGKWKRSDRIR